MTQESIDSYEADEDDLESLKFDIDEEADEEDDEVEDLTQ